MSVCKPGSYFCFTILLEYTTATCTAGTVWPLALLVGCLCCPPWSSVLPTYKDGHDMADIIMLPSGKPKPRVVAITGPSGVGKDSGM